VRPNHPLLRFLDDNFPRTYEWCSHGVRSHVVWLLLLLASTGVSGALASYRASLAGRGLRTGHFEWVNITGALSAREAMAWYDRLQGSIPVSTAEVGATGKLRSTVEGGAPLCLVIREREYAEDKWTQVGAEWMVWCDRSHRDSGFCATTTWLT